VTGETEVVLSDVPVTPCLLLRHTLPLYIPFVSPLSPLSPHEEEWVGIEEQNGGETKGFLPAGARNLHRDMRGRSADQQVRRLVWSSVLNSIVR
jgi:hypothetical protein